LAALRKRQSRVAVKFHKQTIHIAKMFYQYNYILNEASFEELNPKRLSSDQLTRDKAVLSVSHEEYWDLRQYDAMKDAIEKGVSILWLSGNSVHGVTPLTPSLKRQTNRTITRVGAFGGMTEASIREYASFYHDITFRGLDKAILLAHILLHLARAAGIGFAYEQIIGFLMGPE
jgi:hypothetical protein